MVHFHFPFVTFMLLFIYIFKQVCDKPHNTLLYSDFNDLQRYLHNKDDTVIYLPMWLPSGTFLPHLHSHFHLVSSPSA